MLRFEGLAKGASIELPPETFLIDGDFTVPEPELEDRTCPITKELVSTLTLRAIVIALAGAEFPLPTGVGLVLSIGGMLAGLRTEEAINWFNFEGDAGRDCTGGEKEAPGL